MKYVGEMLNLEKELVGLGHRSVLPIGFEQNVQFPDFTNDLDADLQYCLENNIMKRNFDQLSKQDAILVVNKEKHGIQGYLGTAVLMELAIAHFLGKKIFLLHAIPHYNEHRWAHEVSIMQPIIINGNLSLIRG